MKDIKVSMFRTLVKLINQKRLTKQQMKEWIHKLELIVDKLIPLLLILLLIILTLEFVYHEYAEKYRLYLEIADYFIILVFVVDLGFKYNRIRNMKKFIRESWLDIIAVFPFFLVFRLFEVIFGISETTAQIQKVIHIGVNVEKEIGEGAKEASIIAEEASKASRAERFTRFLRPLSRSVRFLKFVNKDVRKEAGKRIAEAESTLKAAIFYEKPGISHHHLENIKK